MNTHWVEVFHVADGDAVVAAVPNHFVFNFFPTAQAFLDQHLLYATIECALQRIFQVVFAVDDAAAASAQ